MLPLKTLLFSALIVLLSQFSFADLSIQEQDHLKRRTMLAMEKIDNAILINNTQDFIISMYQQILKVSPNEEELLTISMLLDGYGLHNPIDRSHFVEQLLVIKAGDSDHISWKFLSENIQLLENLNLKSLPVSGVFEVREFEEDVEVQRHRYLKPLRNNEEYNVYFGYLHAHSELSDGRGDARDAYSMAKEIAGLDYFALTDHSELLHFWPWEKKYKKLIEVSNEFNENGRFAALYGFEWSHPILGHFNVVNTKKYTSAILRPTMWFLMRWLGKKKGAFGRFNHPGRINMKYWPKEFNKLKVYKKALKNVVGIEMFNKRDGVKQYLYERGSFKKNHNFLDNANLKGWYVGTVGGQDNHDADWGLRNDFRVGVWAKELTRQGIVDAYFARRTFATEDKNAWMSFRVDGAEMGSRLTPGNYQFTIHFGDPDGEAVKSVKLVKRGRVIKEYDLSENQTITDRLEGEKKDYFYVVAEQSDGDFLLSSPVWIVK
ncbi:MAG: hypothetical protein CL677_04930 [Bdellovibrionaceae bacterium]|nr:hypothetical protein [Pseudobdellovibrionaceae bacterium]|tara:strand:+ start:203488 stop:204954 length:1467 start_codon:yes stop_codon:yes gene_type:complete